MTKIQKTVFSKRLKEARKISGLNQKELAKKIGHISESAISNYEQSRAEPDTLTLKIIANILNVSVDWLVGNDLPSRPITDFCHPKKEEIPRYEEPYVVNKKAYGTFVSYQQNLSLNNKADFTIVINDQSLNPYYDIDDTAYISISDYQDGDLVCFNYQQKTLIREYQSCGILKAINSSYPDIEIDDNCLILGVVCGIYKNNVKIKKK